MVNVLSSSIRKEAKGYFTGCTVCCLVGDRVLFRWSLVNFFNVSLKGIKATHEYATLGISHGGHSSLVHLGHIQGIVQRLFLLSLAGGLCEMSL